MVSLTVSTLTRCAFLATLATLLQISAALFPGPGSVLALCNTLPLALAAYLSPLGGLLSYFVSGWLTFLVTPTKAIFLLFCSAPFGLALGLFLRRNTQPVIAMVGCASLLAAGFCFIANVFGVPIFGLLPRGSALLKAVFLYYLFTLTYSFAWYHFIRGFIDMLNNTGVLKNK